MLGIVYLQIFSEFFGAQALAKIPCAYDLNVIHIVRYRSTECLMCDNEVYYDYKVAQAQWIWCFEIVFVFIDGSVCSIHFTLHTKRESAAYEIPTGW